MNDFINSHQNLIMFLIIVSLVPYFVHLIQILIKIEKLRRQGPDAAEKEEDIK